MARVSALAIYIVFLYRIRVIWKVDILTYIRVYRQNITYYTQPSTLRIASLISGEFVRNIRIIIPVFSLSPPNDSFSGDRFAGHILLLSCNTP